MVVEKVVVNVGEESSEESSEENVGEDGETDVGEENGGEIVKWLRRGLKV